MRGLFNRLGKKSGVGRTTAPPSRTHEGLDVPKPPNPPKPPKPPKAPKIPKAPKPPPVYQPKTTTPAPAQTGPLNSLNKNEFDKLKESSRSTLDEMRAKNAKLKAARPNYPDTRERFPMGYFDDPERPPITRVVEKKEPRSFFSANRSPKTMDKIMKRKHDEMMENRDVKTFEAKNAAYFNDLEERKAKLTKSIHDDVSSAKFGTIRVPSDEERWGPIAQSQARWVATRQGQIGTYANHPTVRVVETLANVRHLVAAARLPQAVSVAKKAGAIAAGMLAVGATATAIYAAVNKLIGKSENATAETPAAATEPGGPGDDDGTRTEDHRSHTTSRVGDLGTEETAIPV